MTPSKTKNPAASMIVAKEKLIKRLHSDIADVRADANKRIAKIEGRIRVAQTILSALQKGTLKP